MPSFYALDVMRAITGVVPDHRVLAKRLPKKLARASRGPRRTIPTVPSTTWSTTWLCSGRFSTRETRKTVKGRAHYMLALNPALRRSITSRWLREKRAWSSSDGLSATSPDLAPYLRAQRLGARPYSLSALQRFAVCPYQFALAAMHRLEPWVEPEPLVRLDPLTRGSAVPWGAGAISEAPDAEQGALPIVPERVDDAVRTVERVLREVADEYEERLAPAIPVCGSLRSTICGGICRSG